MKFLYNKIKKSLRKIPEIKNIIKHPAYSCFFNENYDLDEIYKIRLKINEDQNNKMVLQKIIESMQQTTTHCPYNNNYDLNELYKSRIKIDEIIEKEKQKLLSENFKIKTKALLSGDICSRKYFIKKVIRISLLTNDYKLLTSLVEQAEDLLTLKRVAVYSINNLDYTLLWRVFKRLWSILNIKDFDLHDLTSFYYDMTNYLFIIEKNINEQAKHDFDLFDGEDGRMDQILKILNENIDQLFQIKLKMLKKQSEIF